MLPDIAALPRTFDYAIPPGWEGRVRIGTMVRVELHGRRVGGWVVALADEPATDRPLRPLAKVTGWGPRPEVIDLAHWAAWRWAGRPATFLRTASPHRAVTGLPGPGPQSGRPGARPPGPGPAPTVLRVPPAGDHFGPVADAAAAGPALVLAPSAAEAAIVAAELRQAGHPVALMPDGWARAAGGGCTVVGTRAAAWAPVPGLAAVVVLDEHDEVYQEERAPTWNARDVAVERARRAGASCTLVSPCPSLEALAGAGRVVVPSRAEERAGWPVVETIDRREDAPGQGLYSARLVEVVRAARPGARVVCVLNRKGRARLLACTVCRELARCEACGGALGQDARPGRGAGMTPPEALTCRRCGQARPPVCAVCGAAQLRVLRIGVTRAREELELLAGQPVAEVTADQPPHPLPGAAVLVGTEAVLHRAAGAGVVAFLDFDQQLLAPRYRAAEAALALLAKAARLVGRRDEGGRVLVQTRLPTHEALEAARHADPGRAALVEAARRAALRLPPEVALARISGPAAGELVRALDGLGIEVSGPAGRDADRWLVRAPDHRALGDALAAAGRPAGRVRVEVDPLEA